MKRLLTASFLLLGLVGTLSAADRLLPNAQSSSPATTLKFDPPWPCMDSPYPPPCPPPGQSSQFVAPNGR